VRTVTSNLTLHYDRMMLLLDPTPFARFAGMETQARGDVELKISMLHAMQTPERRHGVKRCMLAIDDEIEEKHGGRDGEPRRQGGEVEEAQPCV
jgi:hypothetical protein